MYNVHTYIVLKTPPNFKQKIQYFTFQTKIFKIRKYFQRVAYERRVLTPTVKNNLAELSKFMFVG